MPRLLARPALLPLLAALAGPEGLRGAERPAAAAASMARPGPSVPDVPARESVPPQFQRGWELAQIYCATCHLLPSPLLHTKTAWAHHVLPQMAYWLGVERMNYENLPEGKLLQEASLYPVDPNIAQDDWFAIWDYYRAMAPGQPLPPPPKPKARPGLTNFVARKINFHTGAPMISLVKIEPAARRLWVGDAYAGLLASLGPAGVVARSFRLGNPPVSLQDGAGGGLVTLIGSFFPSDMLKGSVVSVPSEAGQPQPLLSSLRRPTDARAGDLNGDGREDLVVCSFGNRLGRLSWFENKGGGQYEEAVLLDRPGATVCELRDMDGDGRLDIIVLTGQAREGIFILYNRGGGDFHPAAVVEQPPAFGFVGFQLVDFDKDGHLDVLAVNGDNGDFPTPHKPYHGVRLYRNDGRNHFQEVWFYPMEGAYKAIAADFDGDGDLDIAAIAYYPDFEGGAPEGFVYLENRGPLRFQPRTIAEDAAGRWMVMDAGDLDGDGDLDLALGSFALGPTTIPVPPAVRDHWKTNGAAVLILENRRR